MAATVDETTTTWSAAFTGAVRGLAAVTAAGAVLGLLVGGVGGRLGMFLLAELNPAASGVESDDGFTIGQFTVSGTVNLMVVTLVLGALGAAIYCVLRPLVIGPRWFRVFSVGLGPAVVVGEQLVHTDGVDFTLLQPADPAIALFVAIPGTYGALLTIVGERWRAPDGFFARCPLPLALLPLLAYGPLVPLLLVLAAGWAVLEVLRRSGAVSPAVSNVVQWAGRAALSVLFVVSLLVLLDEVSHLT